MFGVAGPALSRSVIVHDPFDEEAFAEVLPRAPGLRLVLEATAVPLAEELAFDLFCSFYKYYTKLLPVAEIAAECQGHRGLIDRALGLKEHAKLRAFTRLKTAETAMATELVLDGLLEELARPPAPQPEETDDGTQDEGETPMTDRTDQVGAERMRKLLEDARTNLERVTELIAAWSSGPGQETRLPTERKLGLMREVGRNPRLQRIAGLFNRYRRLGLRDRSLSALRPSQEVVDYVRGGDVARAVAGELSTLALDEREDLFYQKVVTRTLLVYELWRRDEEPCPVYLCIDNSGSMAGDKEVWAKASALALANLALAQGRPVEVVLFGDAADPLKIVSIRPEDDGATRLEKFVDVASYFLGGGTDFGKPLSHVLEAVRTAARRGSELLFVSDGLCPIPEEFVRRFREEKARYDLRVTSVVIGTDPYDLRAISDTTHRLDAAMEAAEGLAAHFASAFLKRVSGSGPVGHASGPLGQGIPPVYDRFLPGPDDG